MWGHIDLEDYISPDSPLNADLNKIVPDKLIAFRGPKDLGNNTFADDQDGIRRFSPQHCVPPFRDLGVTDVVRLNQPEYDPAAFAAAGISHHDLPFDDCTAPPDAVVRRFLYFVDAAPAPPRAGPSPSPPRARPPGRPRSAPAAAAARAPPCSAAAAAAARGAAAAGSPAPAEALRPPSPSQTPLSNPSQTAAGPVAKPSSSYEMNLNSPPACRLPYPPRRSSPSLPPFLPRSLR